MERTLLSLAILAIFLSLSMAKVASSSKEVVLGETFAFLTRFAFEENPLQDPERAGSIFVNITSKRGTQKLLYYGSQETWDEAYYNKSKSCEEKEELAFVRDLIDVPFEEEFQLIRHLSIPFAIRKTYWFVAISHCSGEDIQLSQYYVQFLQGDGSHFSTDEAGILAVYGIYFVYYSVLFSVHFYAMYILSRTVSIHSIFRLFSLALAFQYTSTILHLLDQSFYRSDGEGMIRLKYFGDFLEVCFEISFLGLLLLISKGWTISTKKLTHPISFSIVFGAYALIFLIVFAFQILVVDPASTKSTYQSLPGYILVAMRCLSFLYFIYCFRVTYRSETQLEKRSFYKKFGCFFSIWFLSFPVSMAIIASVDSTRRDQIVVALLSSINAISVGIVAYLLWPSRTYRYFKLISWENQSMNSDTPSNLPYGSI